jgi:probable F420-dependent oxidoreductase
MAPAIVTPPPFPWLSLHMGNFMPDDPGSWQPMLDKAKAADDAGIDKLIVSDHVVFGENLDEYGRPEVGGIEGGKQPTGPDGHWLEPLTLLSVITGMTSTVRLGTGILEAALRRPVTLAKSLATLDVLSGGRVDLGVGVGWQREEYEAAGLSFDGRGKLLDETLAVCQMLWRDRVADYKSDTLEFHNIHMMPKPRQPGGVPILVSGTLNPRVIRRIARFGSGWIPWGPDQKEPQKGLSVIAEAMAAAGRDMTGFKVPGAVPTVMGADGKPDMIKTMEGVGPLTEAGITEFTARFTLPADRSEATDYLAAAVAAFRKAAGRS